MLGRASSYDYDLAVIGGGSGGLAAAKESARLGARTVLFDYVKPSPRGTAWGLGGTCVNVGCIPKKLFHRSAKLGLGFRQDISAYGWSCATEPTFRWETLVSTVRNYIRSLNFSYRVGLQKAGVKYINAHASLSGANDINYVENGEQKTVSASNVLIAVGGRPFVPSDVPGAQEYAITSDDLFYLQKAPGKTLVVGASYIALECGGFLTEFGIDTTIAVRSIVLRGFDRQCSEKVAALMEQLGTKFRREVTPTKIEKTPENKLRVTFSDGEIDEFDTVIYATGRVASLKNIGLDKVAVRTSNGVLGKIITDDNECTNVSNIYAIGDTAQGRPELTPVAIRAGELLARRLFGKSEELMNYTSVATVVFSPIEYGCVGITEEDAISQYGADAIDVYLFEFNPLECSAAHWQRANPLGDDDVDMDVVALSKLIVLKATDTVIGFHCIAPEAGEATQGYALAIKAGLTKKQFDETVGIHPTAAESFHSMTITRRSGESWLAAGGCGGGKCG